MKKFLLTFGLMMCGLLSSHADPTSAPPAEQIPMGYEEHSPDFVTQKTRIL